MSTERVCVRTRACVHVLYILFCRILTNSLGITVQFNPLLEELGNFLASAEANQ